MRGVYTPSQIHYQNNNPVPLGRGLLTERRSVLYTGAGEFAWTVWRKDCVCGDIHEVGRNFAIVYKFTNVQFILTIV